MLPVQSRSKDPDDVIKKISENLRDTSRPKHKGELQFGEFTIDGESLKKIQEKYGNQLSEKEKESQRPENNREKR